MEAPLAVRYFTPYGPASGGDDAAGWDVLGADETGAEETHPGRANEYTYVALPYSYDVWAWKNLLLFNVARGCSAAPAPCWRSLPHCWRSSCAVAAGRPAAAVVFRPSSSTMVRESVAA